MYSMLYAPSKQFNEAEECIYRDEKSSNGRWNEEVRKLNLVIIMLTVTGTIARSAAWSYDCAFIWQVGHDAPYQ